MLPFWPLRSQNLFREHSNWLYLVPLIEGGGVGECLFIAESYNNYAPSFTTHIRQPFLQPQLNVSCSVHCKEHLVDFPRGFVFLFTAQSYNNYAPSLTTHIGQPFLQPQLNVSCSVHCVGHLVHSLVTLKVGQGLRNVHDEIILMHVDVNRAGQRLTSIQCSNGASDNATVGWMTGLTFTIQTPHLYLSCW